MGSSGEVGQCFHGTGLSRGSASGVHVVYSMSRERYYSDRQSAGFCSSCFALYTPASSGSIFLYCSAILPAEYSPVCLCSFSSGVEHVFALVTPGEQESCWSISRGRSRHRSKVHQQIERQGRFLSMSESRRCNVTTRR